MRRHFLSMIASGWLAVSCGGPSEPQYTSREVLLDPSTCQQCHAKHYREWSGSMHAYASRDPVFLAMNRRGQEETRGQLGNFCVKCHAPLAVSEGATTDGLNLGELPTRLQGVGCYFCHNVASVEGTHNNPLVLAGDVTMRGRYEDPVATPAHASAASKLFSGAEADSAALCGACHDIVLPSPPAPAAVELERTFSEWRGSVFAPDHAPSPSAMAPCNSCHMPAPNPRPGEPIAEGPGLSVFPRPRHLHDFVGVDVALDPFPDSGNAGEDEAIRALQRQRVQSFLDQTLRIDICRQVSGDTSVIHVTLDNATAGHNWPTGASQDRRAWVEVVAYRDGNVIYQSGVLAPGQSVDELDDRDLWLFRDRTFNAQGGEAHMFWDVARRESKTISAQATADPSRPEFYTSGHDTRRFPRLPTDTIDGVPDRITARVRISPMGTSVMDDLIVSGHLDRAVRDAVPTFDLLPNRALARPDQPQFASLGVVSMEWSDATRASTALFSVRRATTDGRLEDCVGMRKR